MKYQIKTGAYTQLEITAKKQSGKCGWIKVYLGEEVIDSAFFKYQGYETYILSLPAGNQCQAEIEDLEISLCMLSGGENLLETGVTFLEFSAQAVSYLNQANMGQAYGQKYRNRYHFAAYKNWLNDPNGLCWYQGYYHLFYQYHPNGPAWGNMHWGHAVSTDLLHWTHLPPVAYPQIELLDCPENRGGAFSGSAVVKDDQLHLFYTRHFGKHDRSWQRQWQVTAKSDDGLHFTDESTCIWGTPEGVYYDFRDPKVLYDKGAWYMVLGGTQEGIPAVLLYRSEDLEKWQYQGVLFQEQDPLYAIAECPDLFQLGEQYVLLVGYIFSDLVEPGSRRDTKYYIGTFENGIFTKEAEGLFDYGKDIYAVQTFFHQGRRLCIGWNPTNSSGYIHESGSSNGTMSLPRELSLRDQQLVMVPVQEVKNLEGTCLYQVSGEKSFTFRMENHQEYLLELKQNGAGQLKVSLLETPSGFFGLEADDTGVYVSAGDGSRTRIELAAGLENCRIYLDRSVMEIFFNDGEAVYTRTFFLQDIKYQVSGTCSVPDAFTLQITALAGIWGNQEVDYGEHR